MKDKHWIALIVLIVIIAIVAYESRECETEDGPLFTKAIFDVDEEPTVNITIAITPAERAKGLMNVSYMHPDQGMVFIFPKTTNSFFWMKNTLIPLDMFFVKNDTVMYIAHDAKPCEVDQCPTFGPGQYYDYVIETNSGYAKQYGIDIGTAVELD